MSFSFKVPCKFRFYSAHFFSIFWKISNGSKLYLLSSLKRCEFIGEVLYVDFYWIAGREIVKSLQNKWEKHIRKTHSYVCFRINLVIKYSNILKLRFSVCHIANRVYNTVFIIPPKFVFEIVNSSKVNLH